MPHEGLDTTASLDTLQIRLAPVWSSWSRQAARILALIVYMAFTFGAAATVVGLGLGWIIDWIDQLSLLPMLLIALPLILADMVIVGTLDALVEHLARTWRPSMTLTSHTVQLGRNPPIPLSAVRSWSVEQRRVSINDQKAAVRLSAEERTALADVLGRVVARNQPDGPVGADTVPRPLQALQAQK